MGFKLKEGKTYTTPNGIDLTSAYAVFDVIITEKESKSANLLMRIYQSKDKYKSDPKKNSLEAVSFICNNHKDTNEAGEDIEVNDYDTYMIHDVIASNGSQYTKAYVYLKDKKISKGGFIFEDYEDLI